MKQALQLSLAISLVLGASHSLAIGLGQIQVKSRLNQPLDAEIPVIVDKRGEAESLVVKLASAEEFSRVGIERSQIGVPLEFALGQSARGDTVIKVTSKEAVRAPFLDFLLEANWSNGRVLREYTVLLDPPLTAPASAVSSRAAEPAARPLAVPPPPPPVVATPPAAAPVAKAEPARQVIAAEPKPVVATPPVAVAPPVAKPAVKPVVAATPQPAPSAARSLPPSVAASNGSHYGPVAAGETLWEIAQATLPDQGVSANQLMLALLKANPDAFNRNNINQLKRGAILRIPSGEEIRAVGSMRAAAAQVQSQIAEWRGDSVRPTLLAGSAASTAPSFGNVETAASKRGDDRLALVPPELGKDGLASIGQTGSSAGAAGGNASAAELARANESLATRTQEAGELRTRVKDLEGLQSKNERLISLKDSEIADLQRKLAESQAASAAKPKAETAPPPAEVLKSAEVAAAPVTEAKDDIWGKTASSTAVDPAAAAIVASAPVESSATSTPASTASSVASTPVESAMPVDTNAAAGDAVSSSANAPAATPEPGAATAAAAHADAASTAVVESTPVASSPAPAPTVVTPEEERPRYLDPRVLGGSGIVVLLLGFLALRSRRKGDSPPPKPSLADQFAAGSAAAVTMIPQAADGAILNDEETQLADQIAFRPNDIGARLELLSIYYADNRVEEFRAAAVDMQPYITDSREPEWVQVRAMGEDLLPNDPLFAAASSESALSGGVPAAQRWDEKDGFAEAVDELHWSDEDEIIVPVAAAPLTPAEVDETRYAPARVVASPPSDFRDVEAELAGLDHHAATEGELELSLDDDFDDEPIVVPLATSAKAAGASGRTLTEFSSEKKNDEAFGFDLPPLDFDMEFSKPQVTNTASLADEAVESDDEFFVGEDALGTKLDLARAYADMGDPDGARAMLEEVIAEGDSAQQDLARKLLVELG